MVVRHHPTTKARPHDHRPDRLLKRLFHRLRSRHDRRTPSPRDRVGPDDDGLDRRPARPAAHRVPAPPACRRAGRPPAGPRHRPRRITATPLLFRQGPPRLRARRPFFRGTCPPRSQPHPSPGAKTGRDRRRFPPGYAPSHRGLRQPSTPAAPRRVHGPLPATIINVRNNDENEKDSADRRAGGKGIEYE